MSTKFTSTVIINVNSNLPSRFEDAVFYTSEGIEEKLDPYYSRNSMKYVFYRSPVDYPAFKFQLKEHYTLLYGFKYVKTVIIANKGDYDFKAYIFNDFEIIRPGETRTFINPGKIGYEGY